MQPVQIANPVSLNDIMAEVNGATFISIDTETVPQMRKTIDTEDGRESNPHYGRVKKTITGASVMVFQNKTTNGYDSMVKRRLIQEGKDPGSFELGPRKWGVRVPNLPIVEHNDKQYLEVIFLKQGDVQYWLDDQPVDKSTIMGLSKSSDGEQGGLENKVIIRTFGLDSVTAIRINHKIFTNIVK